MRHREQTVGTHEVFHFSFYEFPKHSVVNIRNSI